MAAVVVRDFGRATWTGTGTCSLVNRAMVMRVLCLSLSRDEGMRMNRIASSCVSSQEVAVTYSVSENGSDNEGVVVVPRREERTQNT